jgi:hypothetical protein
VGERCEWIVERFVGHVAQAIGLWFVQQPDQSEAGTPSVTL